MHKYSYFALLFSDRYLMYAWLYMTQFGKTTLVVHNNLEQTLIFKQLLSGHFAQEANEIWFQEDQLMLLLDINGFLYNMAKYQVFEGKRLLKIIMCQKRGFPKLCHIWKWFV